MDRKKIVIGIPHTGTFNVDAVKGLLGIQSNYGINIQFLKL